MPILFVLLLVVATIVIAALCWSWMQSTRASQRKVDEQNRRIIELLEQIAGKIGK